jgi:CRISPR-associated endonuclease/helicase Cas3
LPASFTSTVLLPLLQTPRFAQIAHVPAPTPELSACWAKTHPDSGVPSLSVRDHSLIVGAVAEAVWCLVSEAIKKELPNGVVTLAAAHDIGKITPGFLLKARPHWDFEGATGQEFYEGNHAKVSQAYLASLPTARGGEKLADWVLAVGGHHGRYPGPAPYVGRIKEGGLTWPTELRNDLLEELEQIFGSLPVSDVLKGPLVHWLTGFTTFSDWIGSNTDWFPLVDGDLRDRETPTSARKAASKAVSDLGWHHRAVATGKPFGALFPGVKSPRPLQEALIGAMDCAGLYVVEAPMGVGKTEAALAGAYRRWTEGDERGLYFALPTQLTSNRIHERVRGFLENVVSAPSLNSLVHGNAWMNPERVMRISPTAGDVQGAADLSEWFASGRKSLLAPFGTGTIDQALMACMPVKHSGLRLFALSGKVVIIDEVHSYDPYTSALVDRTVKWLLQVGCTVIVLSATLSTSRRQSLIKATGAEEQITSFAYPHITKVAKGSSYSEAIAVDPGDVASTKVKIEQVTDPSVQTWQRIADAAESGACVVIIRNTVALAQDAYRQIKSRCRDLGIEVGLLHSRFPQFKRDSNESEWMERLGKDGRNRPKGCVLVATQVVEQSVDIDADLLVTDLAPVDLILQRLGRLHRHQRERPTGFETPVCLVLMPTIDWSQDVKSIKSGLGPSGYVYPPFALFQAERVIKGLPDQVVTLPGDIRALVEQSTEIPFPLPSGAADFLAELEKSTHHMLNTAEISDVFHSPTGSEKEGAATRWSHTPTALLVLLRKQLDPSSRTLEFLNGEQVSIGNGQFNYQLALALHRNAVRVPRYLVCHAEAKQPSWLANSISGAVLGVVANDRASCELFAAEESAPYRLEYRNDTGLSHTRNKEVRFILSSDIDEDSWF